ncbi:WbqC family protein [Nonlabens xiamenensis]|uniref:WbqC family protein n=1 Tax=Nonlabens xiamenensis TaxID=2341043 RepID=UPI001F0C7C61|nr:WbqC family protein [Nonlabens xiamenensis]
MNNDQQSGLKLHPTYFTDVQSLVRVYHSSHLLLERHGSYVKQTHRNRCYIAAANGRLALNIPVIHQGKGHSVPYNTIQIDQSQNWSSNHLKSITSAYRSSPFFEYYEKELKQLFSEIPPLLFDWNIKTHNFLLDQMGIAKDHHFTVVFQKDVLAERLVDAKAKPLSEIDPYIQVFQEKHGFMQGLCGLDLLFNLGPACTAYLKEQTI